MELLTTGLYAIDRTHPPLARALVAIGPFLDGIRFSDRNDLVASGNAVFYTRDRYEHNLSRARLGTLPFFIIAALIVAAWTRALFGEVVAIIAVALFTNEPSVLAHAGLATTDMAATASTIAAAYAFWWWLKWPGKRNALLLGLALAFAMLSKFSAILFVPGAMVAIVAVGPRPPLRRAASSFAIAVVIAMVLIWGGYRFSLATPRSAGAAQAFHDAPYARLVDVRMPMPELWHGLLTVRAHSRAGHLAYALGRWSPSGWWWYFPLALAVKTTIGFLLLLLGGFFVSRREQLAPLAAGVAILLLSLPVSINIGVRHILPVYPFFAIPAGAAVVAVWKRRRVVAAGLCAAAIVPSLLAHPDYLAYFNAFAGPRPDSVLLDSNLDWGQDLLRLERELQRRHITDISLAYSGTAQPDRHGIASSGQVDPMRYTPGWIAISEVLIHHDKRAYRWLDLFQPVARVGKSIRLYYVPSPLELTGDRTIVPETEKANDGAFDRLLLPVWFPGTLQGGGTGLWRCDLVVRNDGAREVAIRTRPGVEPALRLAPRSTLVNPALPLGFAQHGAMLYVARGDGELLHFNVHLHPPDRAGIIVPVVPESATSSSAIEFIDVPMDDDSRATLRVYDLTGKASSAVLRMFDLQGDVPLVKIVDLAPGTPRETFPPAAEVNLGVTFPEMRGRRVRLEIEPPSAQFWAFVSVTRFPDKNMYTLLPD